MHTVWESLARNYIPCLGQTCAKLYTLFRTERTKTIPCPAAHPRMGHIREYSHPRVLSRVNLRSRTDPRSSFCYANWFLGLSHGFLNEQFQEIKLFICHCSFITTVRFLETLQTDYSLACEKHPFLLALRRWEEKRMFSQANYSPFLN